MTSSLTMRKADPLQGSRVFVEQTLYAGNTRKQVIDVHANSRWIRIPLGLPVTVDLPAWTCEAVVVGLTPLANGVVRGAEPTVRPEVRCHCHCASRGCRANDLALLGKRSVKLHAHLETNAAIPIDGNVTTGVGLLRTHGVPDQSAALGY
jgi:hypothetical protein